MTYKVLQEWDTPQELLDKNVGYAAHYAPGETIGIDDADAKPFVDAGILESADVAPRTQPKQGPFAVVVEWVPGSTVEQQQEANGKIAEIMSEINGESMDPNEVLHPSIERLTIKRT